MKKFLTSVLMGTMIFTSVAFATTVTERSDIELVVNGTTIQNENVPIIVNSRTLIPLRDLVTNLGVPDDNEHIIWNNEERTVTIKNDDVEVYLVIDSDVAKVNGEEVKLEAPAMIYNSRTYIPARFVGEALNKKIGWDGYENRVLVRDMEVYNEVKDTLDKATEKIDDMEKMRCALDLDAGGKVSGSLIKMVMKLEMDISQKEMYSSSVAEFMGMQSAVEQYFKDEKCYSKNEAGEWVEIQSEDNFNTVMEEAKSFADIEITDETIYDTLTIDTEKTTDEILVIKNDIKYNGLFQQISDIQSGAGIIDESTKESIENIKDFIYEYQIDKGTGNIRSMNIYMSVYEESAQEDSYIDISFVIDEIGDDFEVYSPIEL